MLLRRRDTLSSDPQPTSGISREAVPALFGVLKLGQYLCSHVRMTLRVWMHVECVPICLAQIDLDGENIGREDFALVIQFRESGENGQECLHVFSRVSRNSPLAIQSVIVSQREVAQSDDIQEKRDRVIEHHVEGLSNNIGKPYLSPVIAEDQLLKS